jgi:hypothetical protein
LIAARGLAWNENFTRISMYLSTLSFAVVSLGLIAGVDKFSDVFFVFALVILPVVVFIGLTTFLRMGAANYHDALAVIGMNLIRGDSLENAPDLEPYFVMGVHDDAQGVGITMAVPPDTSPLVHLIAGTPTLVMVLNSVVAGVIAALALVRFTTVDAAVVLLGGLAVAIVLYGLEIRSAQSKIRRGQQALAPMFPTPPTDRPGA